MLHVHYQIPIFLTYVQMQNSTTGFQVKSAYQLPPDWKENIPYTLDSIQRYCYQNHAQPPELTLPSTRYGSNRKKQLPASGTSAYNLHDFRNYTWKCVLHWNRLYTMYMHFLLHVLTHSYLETRKRFIGKQGRPRSDAT